jgi:hypothetical protein
MPELNLKDLRRDFRLPELRLPEMSRDDIAKALGDARKEIREVRKDLADLRQDFEVPRVAMPAVDMGKLADGAKEGAKQVADGARDNAKVVAKEARKAAEQAGLVKPSRTRRFPFIFAGLVTLGLVTWAFANSPTVKSRLREGAQRARERMADRRSAWDLDDETRAFDATPTAGVRSSTYSDAIPSANSPFADPPSDLPEGLGSDTETAVSSEMPARA